MARRNRHFCHWLQFRRGFDVKCLSGPCFAVNGAMMGGHLDLTGMAGSIPGGREAEILPPDTQLFYAAGVRQIGTNENLMGFASIREFFAQVALVTPEQFEEWNKAWRVAVASGSQESLLAFICRERGIAEDLFLQQLAQSL